MCLVFPTALVALGNILGKAVLVVNVRVPEIMLAVLALMAIAELRFTGNEKLGSN